MIYRPACRSDEPWIRGRDDLEGEHTLLEDFAIQVGDGLRLEYPLGCFDLPDGRGTLGAILVGIALEGPLVCFPALAWHRKAAHRLLPPGSLKKPVKLSVCHSGSMTEKAGEETITVWLGYVERRSTSPRTSCLHRLRPPERARLVALLSAEKKKPKNAVAGWIGRGFGDRQSGRSKPVQDDRTEPWAWSLQGVWQCLIDGKVDEARARCALAAADQSAIDGSWLIAQTSLLENPPSFGSFNQHRPPTATELHHSALLDSRWVEVYLSHVKDLDT